MDIITIIFLEIKRALKSFPKFIISMMLFSAVIALIAFGGSNTIYKNTSIGKIPFAMVMPENSKNEKLMLSILEGMDSIKDNFDIIETDYNNAMSLLEKRDVYGVIVVPENFVRGIMTGENTPADIIFPENGTMESDIIEAVTKAGAVTLSSSQSGIYAMTDFLNENGAKREEIENMEKKLNLAYMDYALSRSLYFNENEVSATGAISTIEYYISSCTVYIMLLSGICSSLFLKQYNKAVIQRLKSKCIYSAHTVIAKQFGIFTLISLSLIMFYVLMSVMSYTSFNITALLMCIAVSWTASALIVLILDIAGDGISGILLLFFVSTIMIFISGGFVPSAFLTDSIKSISKFMPTKYFIQYIGEAFFTKSLDTSSLLNILYLAVIWGIEYIISILACSIKERIQ